MNTKLVLVIVQGSSGDKLVHQLLDAGYRVTEFSSTGGFFRRKSLTLMIGVTPEQVEHVLKLIRDACPTPPGADQHLATVFVLETGDFITI
jgi:uncharacterized protein YaaQ